MANKFLRKRPNRLLTGRNNYFDTGGPANAPGINDSAYVGKPGTPAAQTIAQYNYNQANPKAPSMYNSAATNNSLSMQDIASLGSAGAQSISSLVSGLSSSDVGIRQKQLTEGVYNQMASPIQNDSYANLLASQSNAKRLGDVSKYDLGAKRGFDIFSDALNAGNAGFAAGASLGNPWAAAAAATVATGASLFGSFTRNRKAAKARDKVNNTIAYVNDFNDRSFLNRGDNLNSAQLSSLNANYAAKGGPLNSVHGGYFTNGLQYINNGGTHESNPNEGVPVSIDPEGVPNLVEEGEVMFNDYVYSNRMKVPKGMRKKYKLGSKALTFADAAKRLNRESEERPNDPISKNGLLSFMEELAEAQEKLREKEQMKEQLAMQLAAQQGALQGIPMDGSVYAYGGRMGNIFKGTGGSSNQTEPRAPRKYRHNNMELTENDPLYSYYSPYLGKNGAIDFNKLYDKNSLWSIKRQKILDMLKNDPTGDSTKAFQKWYADQINEYNKGYEGYYDYTPNEITYDEVRRLSQDNYLGFGHNVFFDEGIDEWAAPPKIIRKIKGQNSAEEPTDFPEKYAYYPGVRNGFIWEKEIEPYWQYSYINDYNPETNELTMYYDPVKGKKTGPIRQKFIDQQGNSVKDEEGNEIGVQDRDWFVNKGWDYSLFGDPTELEDGTQVFRLKDPPKTSKYTPNIFDQGWTDLLMDFVNLGLTVGNKPDYSAIDSYLNAASEAASNYPMVKAEAIGDYQKKKYEDIDREVNIANQLALSGIRNSMNLSGGNRGAAQASTIAALNTALNNQGNLYNQAYKANREEDNRVATFNRETNQFNASNKLTADQANQSAALKGREWHLNALLSGANLKNQMKTTWEEGIGNNISNIGEAFNNIARQRTSVGMFNHLMSKDVAPNYMLPYAELYKAQMENYEKYAGTGKKAKGGKVTKRRRKGLTY